MAVLMSSQSDQTMQKNRPILGNEAKTVAKNQSSNYTKLFRKAAFECSTTNHVLKLLTYVKILK